MAMNVKKRIPADGQGTRLHGKQAVQYIWDYYKLPIVVCLILLYILGYIAYGHFTKKETLLHVGLVNVSASEPLTTLLSDKFLDAAAADASKSDVKLYTSLYLADSPDDPDQEYAYASRVKILASIDNETLDIVLMNRQAFDNFSENDYLYNIKELLETHAPEALPMLKPYLTAGLFGLKVSQATLFHQAGFEDDVYLGVIKNSPRMDMAVKYIKYLCG